jgi:hypothetical protein
MKEVPTKCEKPDCSRPPVKFWVKADWDHVHGLCTKHLHWGDVLPGWSGPHTLSELGVQMTLLEAHS